ncbi:3-ketodihydrosphingosine reductase [Tetrabaena socialis]|uniref:3-ketodihydrosphingosine reductase n=1 Tax=Tetrabaena socialis TaxID=47790 RepID=A0A2J7ZWL4_9CHLO|nr:3-ketodihydrosphingosine reductase [Tetrabaena socialis]|eukprot:PNH04648.1 3-ketodihydrosphingosine reductase [Tetrabaena socialis]
MDLTDKHVLITGGSAGIGMALAQEVVKRKGNVTIVARTVARLIDAKTQLEEQAQKLGTGSRIACQAVDVTDAAAVREALALAVRELGPVDLLICNAGSAKLGYFHELDLATFSQQMQVNYFGVLHVVHALYGDMVRRNQGHIVLVGSALSSFETTPHHVVRRQHVLGGNRRPRAKERGQLASASKAVTPDQAICVILM